MPRTITISPLEIPETLSRIISFLDETTLRNSVVLVSRQWLINSRHRVVRELVWDAYSNRYMDLSKALKRLPFVRRLHWDIQFFISKHLEEALKERHVRQQQYLRLRVDEGDKPGPESVPGTSAAVKASGEDDQCEDATMLTEGPLLLLAPTPIRELMLCDRSDILQQFLALSPYLSALTDLRLLQYHSGTVNVGSVIQACPHLQVLHLGSHYCLDLKAPWHDTTTSSSSWDSADHHNQHRRPTLLLTTLVLENTRFLQNEFEQFLYSAPRLQVLKFITLQKLGPSGFAEQIHYDYQHLVNHLDAIDISLRIFHFSIFRDRTTNAAVGDMMLDRMGDTRTSSSSASTE
ncbi:hypothetical protein BGX29_004133 [Mortierella sp. GBA35]|nr:hypothetical protein BGX29_004133 [Mortierella sp. GBA35]